MGTPGENGGGIVGVLVAILERMVKEASRKRGLLGQSRDGLPGRGTACAKASSRKKTRAAAPGELRKGNNWGHNTVSDSLF